MRVSARFICSYFFAICAARLAAAAGASEDSEFDYEHFKTEPSLSSPIIHVLKRTANESALAPGYIFIDTVSYKDKRRLSPLIYADDGTLILNGVQLLNPHGLRTQNTHVCDYLGQKLGALCITEVPSAGAATHRIFDRTYSEVGARNYSTTGHFRHPDPHEFRDTNNGRTFLQAVYAKRPWDLSPLGGHTNGQVQDACFQEVDVSTGREVFRWCSLDYFNATDSTRNDTKIAQNANVKDGTAWDTFHLNALDKNDEGDYLVSIRYYNMIVKVAGPRAKEVHGIDPGSVIWRLGGPVSDFAFKNEQSEGFELQHDARFISTGSDETYLSIHDNHAAELTWKDRGKCVAKTLVVNNKTKTAWVDKQYDFPEKIGCKAQGSARKLPNGNVFVGWGKRPFFTEFAEDGEILLHAQFSKKEETEVFNYRTLKFPWVSEPHWAPKLVAYTQGCTRRKLVCYASWNGATEVDSWQFYVSTSNITKGAWTPVGGSVKKTGFETKAYLAGRSSPTFSHFVRYVFAEALDADGNVLATVRNKTFVPHPSIRDAKCDEDACFEPPDFTYDTEFDDADLCHTGLLPPIIAVVLILLGFEGSCYSLESAWEAATWPVPKRTRLEQTASLLEAAPPAENASQGKESDYASSDEAPG